MLPMPYFCERREELKHLGPFCLVSHRSRPASANPESHRYWPVAEFRSTAEWRHRVSANGVGLPLVCTPAWLLLPQPAPLAAVTCLWLYGNDMRRDGDSVGVSFRITKIHAGSVLEKPTPEHFGIRTGTSWRFAIHKKKGVPGGCS